MAEKHDPEKAAVQLAAKLGAKTRHVCALLGAGASCAAGLPNIVGLKSVVLDALQGEQKKHVENLLEKRNLEQALSRVRRLAALLDDGEKFSGLNSVAARELDKAITGAIIPAVDATKAKQSAHRSFAAWVSGRYYVLPVEIFTLNYDLLVETGLEYHGATYFDGFVGNMQARFRPELVDSVDPAGTVPSSFVRLWKLHGSVNWAEQIGEDGHRRVVRLGIPAGTTEIAAIYPSDEKYDESRRVPFVVLMDRFRSALETPETITLVSGYSFGDQHINELIFDAARRFPRSEIVAFCFEDSAPAPLKIVATTLPNITVLATKNAILSGKEAPWEKDAELPGIWEKSRFLLGDFTYLATFLATRTRNGDA